jgi:hypothetical protein
LEMAMTKASVREHVVGICDKRREEVTKQLKEIYEAELRPTVKARITELVGRTPDWASYIYNILDLKTAAIDALCMSDSKYNGTFAQENAKAANLLSLIESRMMDECWGNMIAMMEKTDIGTHDFGSEKVNEIIAKLQKDKRVSDLVARREDINALRRQLTTLIDKTAGSGKQSYDRMVALGVDMSDYKEPERYLPAVITLTANVCVLNDNC